LSDSKSSSTEGESGKIRWKARVAAKSGSSGWISRSRPPSEEMCAARMAASGTSTA
jgi:hypothetical protein